MVVTDSFQRNLIEIKIILFIRTHPRTNKMKKVTGDLPLGWKKKVEDDGRIIFVNSEKNVQSCKFTSNILEL